MARNAHHLTLLRDASALHKRTPVVRQAISLAPPFVPLYEVPPNETHRRDIQKSECLPRCTRTSGKRNEQIRNDLAMILEVQRIKLIPSQLS
eukprot:1368286-Amphidinium_carterae.1